jgi:hypothetical protein
MNPYSICEGHGRSWVQQRAFILIHILLKFKVRPAMAPFYRVPLRINCVAADIGDDRVMVLPVS